MNLKYVIIGKDNCPYCTNAVNFSKARKLDYEYKNVPNDISLEEAVEIVGEQFRTFPQIVLKKEGENILIEGGFDGLRSFVNSNR